MINTMQTIYQNLVMAKWDSPNIYTNDSPLTFQLLSTALNIVKPLYCNVHITEYRAL